MSPGVKLKGRRVIVGRSLPNQDRVRFGVNESFEYISKAQLFKTALIHLNRNKFDKAIEG